MSVYDYTNEETREASISAAVEAVRAGKLIVLPTDTVYGIGADAFNKDAVQALLEAKGRGRDVPPPVLIGDPNVLHALGVDFPPETEDLVEEYWPGALTVIVKAQPSLMWDLGETAGTVALRMPHHEAAIELLKKTGPLAVSSANKHGKEAAKSVMDAAIQLGDSVEVYLDGGPSELGEPSTIIDFTVMPPQILREGAIGQETIEEKFGPIFTSPEPEEEDAGHESDSPTNSEQVSEDDSGAAAVAVESGDESEGVSESSALTGGESRTIPETENRA